MNRQKIMANRRRDIIIIVGCTILALIGGYGWSRGFGNFTWFRNFDTPGTASVDDAVLYYEPLIQQYAKEYGIESYVPVIEALMQQESSGLGADVMQCSECYYNTEYDQTPGSIQDPEYSIKTGIHYFADCLELAGCKGPGDIRRLRLALQGYNFGHNYIEWAIKRDGGYTEANAQAFSDMMKEQLGWETYGDTTYPEHVLRYYK